VGSRYFQAMKTRLVRGRDFGPEDSSGGASVAIVNETAAHRLWGGCDPLGRRLRLAETATPFEIVGVVADTTYSSLREGAVPILYLFHGQQERSFVGGLLAAQNDSAGADLRGTASGARCGARDGPGDGCQVTGLPDLDSRRPPGCYGGRRAPGNGPLQRVGADCDNLGDVGPLRRPHLQGDEQHREIAIRIACGAGREQVWRFVLRRSLLLVLSGVAAGLALALAASRVVASQLYGIAPWNGPTWIVTTLVLTAVALLVSIAPSRRAMRIDPAAALRSG
jgi:hypothetical protein